MPRGWDRYAPMPYICRQPLVTLTLCSGLTCLSTAAKAANLFACSIGSSLLGSVVPDTVMAAFTGDVA